MNKPTTFQFPTLDTVLSFVAIAGVTAMGVLCVVTTGVQSVFV